jgi:hypothetical protein
MEFLDEKTEASEHGYCEKPRFIVLTTEIVGRGTSDREGDIILYEIRTFPTSGFRKGYEIPAANFRNPEEYVTELKINGKHNTATETRIGESEKNSLIAAVVEHFRAVSVLRKEGPGRVRELFDPVNGIGHG